MPDSAHFLLVFTVFLSEKKAIVSGCGPFFVLHINQESFYIHVALCLALWSHWKRSSKSMAIFRGRSAAGLAMLSYWTQKWKDRLSFGARNEELVEKLKRNAGRYGLKVDTNWKKKESRWVESKPSFGVFVRTLVKYWVKFGVVFKSREEWRLILHHQWGWLLLL